MEDMAWVVTDAVVVGVSCHSALVTGSVGLKVVATTILPRM